MNDTSSLRRPPAGGRPNSDAQSRREFFRGVGRNLALGAVAVLAAVLTTRPPKAAGRQKCVNRGICRGCSSFDGCGLPAALSARQAGVKAQS